MKSQEDIFVNPGSLEAESIIGLARSGVFFYPSIIHINNSTDTDMLIKIVSIEDEKEEAAELTGPSLFDFITISSGKERTFENIGRSKKVVFKTSSGTSTGNFIVSSYSYLRVIAT